MKEGYSHRRASRSSVIVGASSSLPPPTHISVSSSRSRSRGHGHSIDGMTTIMSMQGSVGYNASFRDDNSRGNSLYNYSRRDTGTTRGSRSVGHVSRRRPMEPPSPRPSPYQPLDTGFKPCQNNQRRGYENEGDMVSPESTLNSTIGSSAAFNAASSTCSTLTFETTLMSERNGYKRSTRNHHHSLTPFPEKGRDPETTSAVPNQVKVPQKELVVISNMPKDIGHDRKTVPLAIVEGVGLESITSDSRGEVEGRSRKKRDKNGKHKRSSSKGRSKTRRDGERGDSSYDSKKDRRRQLKRDERNIRNHRTDHSRRGDRSFQPSLTESSVRSHNSRYSVRHDIDPEGYCAHHPDIQLMKPNEKDDEYWTVVRKKCPECIREDCPSMLGGHSSTSSFYTGKSSMSKSKGSDTNQSAFLLSALQTPEEIEEEEATGRFKRRLAARAYHFPGNSWCEDWFQYLSNTHTVLGLFFHHPLHPLKAQERLVILFGSIAIGLTISNITYLYFIRNGFDVNEEVFTIGFHNFIGLPDAVITKLMITLWTLGSFLHTIFDLGLWHMKACTLCRYGGQIDDRMARWGRVTGLLIVIIAMAAGSYAVLLRASIEYKGVDSVAQEVEESIRNSEIYEIDFGDKRSFQFLLGYLVEFVLALFVYYPLAVTVLFSGVLGCGGRVPILGGRLREMKRESRYELSKKSPKILKTLKLDADGIGTDETEDVYSRSYNDDEYFDHFDERQIL